MNQKLCNYILLYPPLFDQEKVQRCRDDRMVRLVSWLTAIVIVRTCSEYPSKGFSFSCS
jgi:hypothetical protein